jgi:hypothetical protein
MIPKKKGIFWLFLLCIVQMTFFSCASSIPMTSGIAFEVGEAHAAEFQYYLSKTVTLRLCKNVNKAAVKGGLLIRKRKTAREQIILKANLPGLVHSYHSKALYRERFGLDVSFEKIAGHPTLSFMPGMVKNNIYWRAKQNAINDYYGLDEDEYRYYLVYDYKAGIVEYGNDRYFVYYDGEEPPYLTIKMKQSSKSSARSRKASGLKLWR